MALGYETRDGVAWATLERPEVLNALDAEHLDGLLAAVARVAADDATHVLVITGSGRAFSVGGDIKAMDGMSEDDFRATARRYQRLARDMRALDKPVLAAINGYCLGGGLELALMCDLRIAAASARLGLPDAQLGFSPTGGLTWLLPRLIGAGRAMDLALDAEPIDAAEAERIGLVPRVVEDAELMAATEALARKIAAWPRTAMANTKRALGAGAESGFEAALELEEDLDVDCFRDAETRKNLAAFLNSRREP